MADSTLSATRVKRLTEVGDLRVSSEALGVLDVRVRQALRVAAAAAKADGRQTIKGRDVEDAFPPPREA